MLPLIVSAQELSDVNGICHRAIAGSDTNVSHGDAGDVIVDCFGQALNFCATVSSFTDCIGTANDAAFHALEVARNNIDSSFLASTLPGTKAAWAEFEESLESMRDMEVTSADDQMERFRKSFEASMLINDFLN